MKPVPVYAPPPTSRAGERPDRFVKALDLAGPNGHGLGVVHVVIDRRAV